MTPKIVKLSCHLDLDKSKPTMTNLCNSCKDLHNRKSGLSNRCKTVSLPSSNETGNKANVNDNKGWGSGSEVSNGIPFGWFGRDYRVLKRRPYESNLSAMPNSLRVEGLDLKQRPAKVALRDVHKNRTLRLLVACVSLHPVGEQEESLCKWELRRKPDA